jgi:hypothetical protein
MSVGSVVENNPDTPSISANTKGTQTKMLDRLWPANLMKTRRERFLLGKTSLSDEEFLMRIGINRSPQSAVAVALRRTMAKICSIAPETLHPDDQPRTLCSIMDWGMPNWGWLVCVDYGEFSDPVDFGVLFEDEYCELTGKSNRRWQKSEWVDYLPSFAGYYTRGRWSGIEPATFGEWVKQAVDIMLRTE